MATPSASSIVNFVKKYPITLCGFSLLFMPSVHRLLLYFTPLLLSTAIFIVAMLSWGPSAESSDERDKTKGKRNEWAFNGSLKIYDEDDEEEEGEEKEEEEEEVAQVSQARKEELSVEEKESKKLEAQIQEPDPDFDEESKHVGTASIGAIFPDQAEPDPDLGGDGVGTVSNGADLHRDQGSATPDLQGDCVGTASSAADEPDPDLHGEQHVDAVHNHDFSAARYQLHAAPDQHRQHHGKLAPINHDEQAAAGDHHYLDSEPDHLDYHDAASDQANHGDDYGDSEANQGDDYHDAEADPDLHESDGEAAHAKSEGAGAGTRVENDDVRAAIAELRQKLGLVQRDGRDHMHPQQLAKGLQTLQAAA